MKVEKLVPPPSGRLSFRRSHQKFLGPRPGCYALVTFSGVVLYVGLTINLHRRMGNHLDTPAKTAETAEGRAFWFYWKETAQINKVERTWMNIHIQHEGRIPILNSIYSPL